jgi:hypothetical protein
MAMFKFSWSHRGAELIRDALNGYVEDRNFSEIGEQNFIWDVAHQIDVQLQKMKQEIEEKMK